MMRLALLCFACLLVSTIPSSGKALEEQMTFISHNSNRGTERKSLTKDTAYKSLTAAQLNKMLSGCPSSMYLDMVSHKCVSSCPDSTYSYNNLCVETCPPQYPAIDASSRKCLATCPQDKLVYLVDNIYVCVDSCPPGYNYIHGQQCLQTCPPYTSAHIHCYTTGITAEMLAFLISSRMVATAPVSVLQIRFITEGSVKDLVTRNLLKLLVQLEGNMPEYAFKIALLRNHCYSER
ncbi:uncharacterized protein Gasu_38540 [Galdieria sulphuraria]|uniref:Uncharacterized protein n=1 Tax=Galdieria sulphuraria TaxID=130081 RepID=M2VZ92_GALSU|nr:uncharacterized protein Gasu_38540 [Galdieria sulphuraria]EME28646.1 hypothetical protein Gasu_38540 [Galdieria sulphuraria]|eukprot:XP_005705166.1 hypothetical protein Gasu_38540 [Galdieria sulphuraria]